MKNVTRRIFALVLTMALVLCAIPAAFADDDDMPTVEELMDMLPNGVTRPRKTSMLDEPEEMYVKSRYGNVVYILKGATKNSKILDTADEGSIVTVYAIQNGFALGIIEDNGQGGWINADLLSEEYYDGPNPSDTTDLEKGVQRPINNDYIDEYETKYVKTKYGVRAYLLKKPDSELDLDENLLAYVYEGEEVTVLARRGKYSFIISEDGKKGWVATKLLTSEY